MASNVAEWGHKMQKSKAKWNRSVNNVEHITKQNHRTEDERRPLVVSNARESALKRFIPTRRAHKEFKTKSFCFAYAQGADPLALLTEFPQPTPAEQWPGCSTAPPVSLYTGLCKPPGQFSVDLARL